MLAIGAPDSRESLAEIPTFQKLPDYKGDYRPLRTAFFSKKIIIAVLELFEMFTEQSVGGAVPTQR